MYINYKIFIIIIFLTIGVRIIHSIEENISLLKCTDFKPESLDIHSAAFFGCNDRIEYLLKNHADINQFGGNGNTPLITAVEMKNIKTVKFLLQKGAKPNFFSEGGYRSPLMAATFEDTGIIKLLIDYGADVNLQNKNGISPLFNAVTFDRLDIIKLLLAHGADINPKSGLKPILAAVSVKIFEFLVSQGADPWSRWPEGDLMIYNVAMQGSSDLLQKLTDLGMGVNSFNHKGYTPLMLAASFGKLENVKILVKAGANIQIENKKGQTSLDLAKEEGHKEIIDYLQSLSGSK